MYTIYVVFKCVPGKREEYIEKLKAEGIVDEVRRENGCIRYDYYFAENDPDEILLIEAWESKKHMARLREPKTEYVVSTKLGEFEIKE